MLAVERKNRILEILQEEKRVVVSALSEHFHVSEETIRRDLDKLEREGFAIKSYGGAVLNESSNTDMPFSVRRKKNMEGKKVIAAIVAEEIGDGDHIFIDASTTALSIVNALRGRRQNLTVITNSIEVLLETADDGGWDVISTGGKLYGRYFALVGPRAVEVIHTMNADKVVLSCKGLDMERGVTDANELFSQVKQNMLAHARIKILAADYTKFDTVAFSHICGISDLDMVVTDRRPSAAWLKYFEERHIACRYGSMEQSMQDTKE